MNIASEQKCTEFTGYSLQNGIKRSIVDFQKQRFQKFLARDTSEDVLTDLCTVTRSLWPTSVPPLSHLYPVALLWKCEADKLARIFIASFKMATSPQQAELEKVELEPPLVGEGPPSYAVVPVK